MPSQADRNDPDVTQAVRPNLLPGGSAAQRNPMHLHPCNLTRLLDWEPEHDKQADFQEETVRFIGKGYKATSTLRSLDQVQETVLVHPLNQPGTSFRGFSFGLAFFGVVLTLAAPGPSVAAFPSQDHSQGHASEMPYPVSPGLPDPVRWSTDAATGLQFRRATAHEAQANSWPGTAYLVENPGLTSTETGQQVATVFTPLSDQVLLPVVLHHHYSDALLTFIEVPVAGPNQTAYPAVISNPAMHHYGLKANNTLAPGVPSAFPVSHDLLEVTASSNGAAFVQGELRGNYTVWKTFAPVWAIDPLPSDQPVDVFNLSVESLTPLRTTVPQVPCVQCPQPQGQPPITAYIRNEDGGTAPPPGYPSGPAGYAFCSYENSRCAFTGVKDVAYGANGHFLYQQAVQLGTDCTNAAFGGDPAPGSQKACFTHAASTSVPPTFYFAEVGEMQFCTANPGGTWQAIMSSAVNQIVGTFTPFAKQFRLTSQYAFCYSATSQDLAKECDATDKCKLANGDPYPFGKSSNQFNEYLKKGWEAIDSLHKANTFEALKDVQVMHLGRAAENVTWCGLSAFPIDPDQGQSVIADPAWCSDTRVASHEMGHNYNARHHDLMENGCYNIMASDTGYKPACLSFAAQSKNEISGCVSVDPGGCPREGTR
ncbi:MAG TPA: hypothetical protein VM286_05990 [Candidatus Thermoplasmatota archaeon]|nr:hypothetical protein [Candidatus Thermoplasmatota archaeon]